MFSKNIKEIETISIPKCDGCETAAEFFDGIYVCPNCKKELIKDQKGFTDKQRILIEEVLKRHKGLFLRLKELEDAEKLLNDKSKRTDI